MYDAIIPPLSSIGSPAAPAMIYIFVQHFRAGDLTLEYTGNSYIYWQSDRAAAVLGRAFDHLDRLSGFRAVDKSLEAGILGCCGIHFCPLRRSRSEVPDT